MTDNERAAQETRAKWRKRYRWTPWIVSIYSIHGMMTIGAAKAAFGTVVPFVVAGVLLVGLLLISCVANLMFREAYGPWDEE